MLTMSNKGKGFTLIEFMIAATIFSLFLYTLYSLFAGGLRAYKKGEAITLMKKQASNFLEWLSTDINAIDTNDPTFSSDSMTFYRYNYTNTTTSYSITYQYNSSNGTITRYDGSTGGADITFGGEENIYFYCSGTIPFSYDTDAKALTVDFYTQYGKVYNNQTWTKLNLVRTLVRRPVGTAQSCGVRNDAIEDPGSPSGRIRFMK